MQGWRLQSELDLEILGVKMRTKLLSTLAICAILAAAGAAHAGNHSSTPGAGASDAGAGNADRSTPQGSSDTGASASEGAADAGSDNSDGASDAGSANADGAADAGKSEACENAADEAKSALDC